MNSLIEYTLFNKNDLSLKKISQRSESLQVNKIENFHNKHILTNNKFTNNKFTNNFTNNNFTNNNFTNNNLTNIITPTDFKYDKNILNKCNSPPIYNDYNYESYDNEQYNKHGDVKKQLSVELESLDLAFSHQDIFVSKKNAKELINYEYCHVCEQAMPCFCSEGRCQYEEDLYKWNKNRIKKANIHSNMRDITDIMEKIQYTRKRQDENNIDIKKNKQKKDDNIKKKADKKDASKKLSDYDKFYFLKVKIIKENLDKLRNGQNECLGQQTETDNKTILSNEHCRQTIEKRLDALKNIEKKHLNILLELFNEYTDMEERIL
ncbi:conserved protein, unknown function [Hepatocystis sp. ex Piliocolobus tephrosceles]|nr:conserved protein, unknown function [Hepatocystis sp. ex Piliocolobus tephrosceles]